MVKGNSNHKFLEMIIYLNSRQHVAKLKVCNVFIYIILMLICGDYLRTGFHALQHLEVLFSKYFTKIAVKIFHKNV
jgi:hypothetical protein